MGIKWYQISWSEEKLAWADFRDKVIGATNPLKAAPNSLRGILCARWEELGLPAKPFGADNGFHASASPLEAAYEMSVRIKITLSCIRRSAILKSRPFSHHAQVWLGIPPSKSSFYSRCVAEGITPNLVLDWIHGECTLAGIPELPTVYFPKNGGVFL